MADPRSQPAPGQPLRRRALRVSRVAFVSCALVAALLPGAQPVAAATLTQATGGSQISADTAAGGGNGAYSPLAGPTISEAAGGEIGMGTLTLTLPAGFAWNTAAGSVAATGSSCAGMTLSGIGYAAQVATVTIQARSTGPCSIAFSGLGVRPTAGTPRASGSLSRGGSASIPGVVAGASLGSLAVVPGAPSGVGFLAAPGSAVGGAAFATQPMLAIRDQFGSTVTSSTAVVSLALGSNPGTATLTCTGGPTKTAVAGVATFAGCALDRIGAGYTLVASSAGIASATSPAFNVGAGPAARLAFGAAPGGGTGGTAWATQPAVRIEDAGGNLTTSTSTVTLAIASGPATGVLACAGPLAAPAIAGVATYAGCAIDVAGGYTVRATAPGLTTAVSGAFNVTVGARTKLVFTAWPGPSVAGTPFATQPRVAVTDAGGNTVAGAADLVTLGVTPGTGTAGATLACAAPSVGAVGGVADFSACRIDTAGANYTLTASASGLASGVSQRLTVTAAPASSLAFSAAPAAAGTTGGTAFASQPVVRVIDAFGNTVTTSAATVTLSIAPGAGQPGATLACTGGLAKAATAGIAAFAGCKIDKAGAGYQLVASATGLAAATTGPIAVGVGAPAQLAFAVLPGASTGGVPFPAQPVVAILDAGGNPTTATLTVTLAIVSGTGTSGATLACLGGLTKAAVAGTATFAGCAINKAGTGYVLRATSGSLSAASSAALDIAIGPPAALSFSTQPGGGVAGNPWAKQPVVSELDAGGNLVPTGVALVTLAMGANPGSGTLSCALGLSRVAAAGAATFSGCAIQKTGSGYTLVASAPGLADATSTTFSITPAPPAALVIATSPAGGTGGTAWSTQPVVRVVDGFGNTATAAVATVTLGIVPGTGTPGATLACGASTSKAVASGLASFTGCSIGRSGTGYALVATAPGLTGATSGSFDVAVGAPAKVTFLTSPGGGTGGTPWTVQPVVTIVDAGGNRTGSSASVALSITPGSGASGAVLTCPGSTSVAAVSGVATFAGCGIDRAAGGYTLKATSGSLTTATSAAFGVTTGPAAKLAIGTLAGGGPAGAAWAVQPVVVVADAGGNVVATATDDVSIAIASGPAGAVLSCPSATVTAIAGAAAFTGCSADRTGSYTLQAAAAGLAAATTTAFNVTPGAPAGVAIVAQPGGGTGGIAWPGQPSVRIVDAFGNTVTSSTATVSLAIAPGSGTPGASLTCGASTSKAAVSGVATFTGCRIDLAGAGYLLAASAPGLAPTVTGALSVATGPAALLAFSTQPGGGTGGTAWAVQPEISITDAGGNPVATGAPVVTLAIATGPTGAVLVCDAAGRATAVGGIATFSGCRVDKAGSYTIRATATGLATATSLAVGVAVGPPARLAFSAAPAGTVAGVAFATQPRVIVQDAGGNTVTTATDLVSLSITAGTGGTGGAGATLTCATSLDVAAVAGIVAFGGCRIDRATAGYTLSASAAGLVSATSASFSITPGVAAALAFRTSPAGGTGGLAWAVQPVVVVTDTFGNVVATSTASVTLSLTPGTGALGATLACSGSLSKSAVSGVATFAGCRIDRAADGYSLSAASGALAGGASDPFDVQVGPAVGLDFAAEPGGGGAAAAWAAQPVVVVVDAGGNTVTSSEAPISIAVSPAGAALTCTGGLTQVAAAGVAAFAGCAVNLAAAGYTLTASAAGLSPATSAPFAVLAGSASQLAFVTGPGGGTGGTAWSTQPVVQIADAGGNLVSMSGITVALTISSNAAGGTLACPGGTSRTTASGIAAFTGCSIDRAGLLYRITASAQGSGLSDVVSGAFNVTVGPAARLVFSADPSGATGGTPFAGQPIIATADAGGNLTTGSAIVTLAISAGTGGPGATLTCPGGLARPTSVGQAAFAGCAVDRAGTGYQLAATALGLTPALSAAFDVAVGPPAGLVFTTQPSGGSAGAAWTSQPVVAYRDAGGNVTPAPGPVVSLSVATNPASGTLTCAGGPSQATVAGAASFSGCTIDRAGSGYVLRAAAIGLAAATSTSFGVVPGVAANLTVATQPAGAAGGSPFASQPLVRVEDAFGNLVAGGSAVVSLAIAVNPGGGTLSCNGAESVSATGGVATFAGCRIDRVGVAYSLVATSPGLAPATSSEFDVVTGPPATLAFSVSPSGGTGGAGWSVGPMVAVRDAGGNPTAAAVPVTIAVGVNPGAGALTCPAGTVHVATAGMAAFIGCSIDRVGTGYTLVATSPGMPPVTSAPFDIGVGPAALLAFAVQPSGGAAGSIWAVQPTIGVTDSGGNLITNAAAQVTLAAGPGALGSLTCSGGMTIPTTGGLATFSGCSSTRLGSGQVVVAAAPGLVGVTSAPFSVTVGTPARLIFAIEPAGAAGGAPFATQPVVGVTDAYGNPVTTGTVQVNLALGDDPAGATLSCAAGLIRTTTLGRAAFSGCRVDRVGTGYTLLATAPGLASASSASYDVAPGLPARLAFATDPGDGRGGSALGVQPVVQLLDAGGNLASDSGTIVTLALTTGSGTAGASLTCPGGPTAVAQASRAIFVGCSVDRTGAAYTLTAAAPGMTAAASGAFNVTPGAPAALRFATQPSGGTGGAAWPGQPVVIVTDAGGNTVAAAVPVSLSLSANPTGALFTCAAGGATAVSAAGVATFTGCALDKVGTGYGLTASAPGLGSVVSSPFSVAAGPPVASGFTVSPAGGPADRAWSVQPAVALLDAGGNATKATAPVTLAIASGTGAAGASLTCPGGVTASAVAGVAAFSGCQIDRAGTGYLLVATGPGIAPAVSRAFDVAPPAAVISFSTSAPVVTFGSATTLRAAFAKLGNGAQVALEFSDSQGSGWVPLTTLTANASGIATYTFKPSTSRTYRARYLGSATLAPATSAVIPVVVRSVVALAPAAKSRSPRTVARGATLTFTATWKPFSQSAPRAVITFTVSRLGRGGVAHRVASRTVTVSLLGNAKWRYRFATAGTYTVSAKAGATVRNAGSLASNVVWVRAR